MNNPNFETPIRRTMEQKRAGFAWDCILDVEAKSDDIKKKYGTLARRLPTLMQINGLGTTLAFVLSKAKQNGEKSAHGIIYSHLNKWIQSRLDPESPSIDLMQLIRQTESDYYRQLLVESIEFAIWLRRYVEAKDWGSVEEDETK